MNDLDATSILDMEDNDEDDFPEEEQGEEEDSLSPPAYHLHPASPPYTPADLALSPLDHHHILTESPRTIPSEFSSDSDAPSHEDEDEDDATLHDHEGLAELASAVRQSLRVSIDCSLSPFAPFFDVSCLEALDDLLLSSPTDSFADVCYAQSVSDAETDVDAGGSPSPDPHHTNVSPSTVDAPDGGADVDVVVRESEDVSGWRPGHVGADSWRTLTALTESESQGHSKTRSIDSAKHELDDVRRSVSPDFAIGAEPRLGMQTLVLSSWETIREVEEEDEREVEGCEEKLEPGLGRGLAVKSDSETVLVTGQHIHFPHLSSAVQSATTLKSHSQSHSRVFVDPATEVAFLFSRPPPDPTLSIHYFPRRAERCAREEEMARKGVVRTSADAVLRGLAGLRARSGLFR